jgi:hypothetical protein
VGVEVGRQRRYGFGQRTGNPPHPGNARDERSGRRIGQGIGK